VTRHELDDEVATLTPAGWVMRAWCLCEFPFLVTARTVREARRKVWRRVEEHQGFTAAAGPGWTGVGV